MIDPCMRESSAYGAKASGSGRPTLGRASVSAAMCREPPIQCGAKTETRAAKFWLIATTCLTAINCSIALVLVTPELYQYDIYIHLHGFAIQKLSRPIQSTADVDVDVELLQRRRARASSS
jgi:hypothetical protein